VRSTGYEAPHYAIFSTLLSLHPSSILLSTLFSNTLSLCSSFNVRDQVSHPYRTTGKIVLLYILIFMFIDSRREDIRFCTEKVLIKAIINQKRAQTCPKIYVHN
jgi:hypothetical protein